MPTPPETIDFYKLLKVPYSASSRDITRAYRDAMKDAHPDRVDPSRRPAAEERAKLLNQAWRTLTKPTERRKYDQELRKDLVQRQLMSSYFGGMGIPGSEDDRYGTALRRGKSDEEKREQVESQRSAFVTILLVFGGATALVFCLIVVWAVVSGLVHAML